MYNKYINIDKLKLNNEIIELYLAGNSFVKITNKIKNIYNISVYTKELKKILFANNIKLRTKEERYKIISNHMMETNLQKYGNKCSLRNPIIAAKAKITNLKKYGTENVFSSEYIKEKIKQTNKKKYNTEYPAQNLNIKNKIKLTCLYKYGVEYVSQVEYFKNKARQTCIKKYHVVYPMQSKIIQAKSKQTCLKKYNKEFSFQSENNKNKTKITNIKKYGVENIATNQTIKNKIKKTMYLKYGSFHPVKTQYKYKNIIFNSFPELCFYLYHIKIGAFIIYEPIGLEYYYNNKKYMYYPDFEVNNVLYELKGPHLVNKNTNLWQNPFNHTLDKLCEEKQKCAINNNVKILYFNDYIKYINWFNENNYKKESFKITKHGVLNES